MESEKQSEHSHLYKFSKKSSSIENRRKKILSELKQRRNNAVDERRNLYEIFESRCDYQDAEPMEISDKVKNRKRKRYFQQRLMLSEWFSDIPEDLEENWIVKICPLGKRNLIVAHMGITKVFDRKGNVQGIFKSALPGGSKSPTEHKYTVLDCIYHFKSKTHFILDVIAWNSFVLTNCDTEFRFFFLKSKLEEVEIHETDLRNNVHIKLVEGFPAQLPLIQEKLSKPFEVDNVELQVDGVLFYHKETLYHQGITPLVGWLKPYMIPEVLHIPINGCYMAYVPKNYVSLKHYLRNKNNIKKKSYDNSEEVSIEDEMEAVCTHEDVFVEETLNLNEETPDEFSKFDETSFN